MSTAYMDIWLASDVSCWSSAVSSPPLPARPAENLNAGA